MTLWDREEADAASGGRSTGPWRATGVSIDTRSLSRGDLFVALTDRRDGHDFASAAFRAGASAAMVSRIPAGVSAENPLLVVPDVQAGLEGLARAARDRCGAARIAVTGSVGKTSTKDMLRRMLSGQGRTHAAVESFNNHWGVPLTLARMPRDAEFAIFEIGMNCPGEIAPLSRMVRPRVALITEIAPAHMARFASLEEIAEEKASIFEGLAKGGTAIVNADSPGFDIMAESARQRGARLRTFGESPDADLMLRSARIVAGGTVMQVRGEDGENRAIMLSALGAHFARNALGALAAVRASGADVAAAAEALRDWLPPSGRGTRHDIVLRSEAPPLRLIDDAFNSNPASLSAALSVLVRAEMPDADGYETAGRRIAILGDMLELGSDETARHAGFSRHPEMPAVSRIHCAGPLMRHLHRALPSEQRGVWRESAEGLAEMAQSLASPGDIVLVKGSKGSGISAVAAALRNLDRVGRSAS